MGVGVSRRGCGTFVMGEKWSGKLALYNGEEIVERGVALFTVVREGSFLSLQPQTGMSTTKTVKETMKLTVVMMALKWMNLKRMKNLNLMNLMD